MATKPLLFSSFIVLPFRWIVGTVQFTRIERAWVVAFPFPTILGRFLPTRTQAEFEEVLFMAIFNLGENFADDNSESQNNQNAPDLTMEQISAIKENAPRDKNGKYIFDCQKPMGTPENPIVVGMPEYSDILVYDGRRKLWLFTDGLGNGWIR